MCCAFLDGIIPEKALATIFRSSIPEPLRGKRKKRLLLNKILRAEVCVPSY